MRIKKLTIFIAVIGVFISSVIHAQVSISSKVIGTSGGNSLGSDLQVSWTLGETFTTELTGVNLALTQGFQQSICTIKISTHPQNSSICQGNNTSFTVTANETGASYQWEVNTGSGFVSVVGSSVYSGQNTPTLSLAFPPAVYNGYQYRCVVRNNGCSATSSTANLSLSGSAEALNIVNINPISGLYSQTAVAYTIALNKLEPNANVIFKSGNAIELMPGFETRTGVVFSAKIEGPCGFSASNVPNFDNLPKELRK
jgi:hypothetical protein